MKMPILLANGKTNIEWVFAIKRYEPPMHSFSFSSHQKQTHTHTQNSQQIYSYISLFWCTFFNIKKIKEKYISITKIVLHDKLILIY